MSAFLLILATLLLLDLLWWWLSDRWLRKHASGRWRMANALFLAAQFGGFAFLIGGRVAGVRFDLPTLYLSSIYLWHLLLLPVLLAIGIGSLPLLLFLLFRRLRRPDKGAIAPVADPSPGQSRRQFLITAATVTPPLVNLALTGFSQNQLDQFRVRELTLFLPDLPPALSGATICHVTDLHVGPFTSEKVIRRVAETINALRADLIVATGDLINGKLSELPLGVEFLRSLESRSGTVTIEGNHDLFEGRAAFEDAVRAAGLRLLVNQTATLRVRDFPVQLLGLRWGGPSQNARASSDLHIAASMRELLLQREDQGAFPILLAHHPHAFDSAAAAKIPLTLAGHTHGGQLMLNPQVGAGPLLFRYWSGLYQRDRSQLVVGNGVGNWFPLRTAAPAEIIRLILRRAT